VFDIGAHQGVVALMLSRIVGPEGLVVAVEANGHNAEVARENGKRNAASNLKVLHAAAGSTDGVLEFSGGFNGSVELGDGITPSCQVEQVAVSSMANTYGHPDVVMVDVEGFEGHVLQGAGSVLDGRTDFVIEVHTGCGLEKYGSTLQSILDFFHPGCFDLLWTLGGDSNLEKMEDGRPSEGVRHFLIALGKT
jgi:FkbM family methyltransferase